MPMLTLRHFPFLPIPLLSIELWAQFALVQSNLVIEECVLAGGWQLSRFPIGNVFVRLVVESVLCDMVPLDAVIFFNNIHS
jgi:hypothetical protein